MALDTILLIFRGLQALIAIPLIAAISYANAHPSYWDHIKAPAGWTIFTAILTLISIALLLFLQLKKIDLQKLWKAVLLDVINIAAYIIALALLFKPRERRWRWEIYIDEPPTKSWYAGCAMAIAELVLFIVTAVLMWRVSRK